MIAFTLTYFIYEVAIMKEYLESGMFIEYKRREKRLKCERAIMIGLFSTSFASKSLLLIFDSNNH